jgi:aminobenzoyl-glutamate utilization protein B
MCTHTVDAAEKETEVAMTGGQEKQFALEWVERQRAELSDFDLEIWRYAEPAWREYRSARAYVARLRAAGFAVEEGSGGMPTAFVATWGDGTPVLGAYAEYDAVPGNSQQPVPYPSPREGLHPWAAGHTDPHSMLGVAGLTGVLGAKAAMERFGLRGTLRFYGEPAEKVCGAKPVHAAKGYYDGVDAFIAYHPHRENTTVWDTQCGSYWSAVFSFECVSPERWNERELVAAAATAHATARCPGAIDALCLMYTLTKYTKEAMFPHTGTWTLNEFILAGGDATSDNLPPRFSQIQYSWRSPDLGVQDRIYEVLANNARQAAAATGCVASVRWVSRTRVGLTNHALADLTYRNLERVGPPRYGETARGFGRAIQQHLGQTPLENPFLPIHEQLIRPQAYEEQVRQLLPPWQVNFTSDDYVEYTWHAPTVRLYTARPVLAPTPTLRSYPAWAYNALGGVREVIDPGMFVAGKTIAATLIDLLTEPEELERARAEFVERTGGGVGGSRWVAPLLSRDFAPPVDLRWPEYVTTPRGTEWWIPTPQHGMGERL